MVAYVIFIGFLAVVAASGTGSSAGVSRLFYAVKQLHEMEKRRLPVTRTGLATGAGCPRRDETRGDR
jgi:hypothetical protein